MLPGGRRPSATTRGTRRRAATSGAKAMANQAILTGMDETTVSQRDRTLQAAPPKLYALVAEYDNVDAVMAAAEKVRDAGFTKWDVHAPFPIHGIDPAMGNKPTVL